MDPLSVLSATEDVPPLLPPALLGGDQSGGRVLLADDNADMREYVRRLLAGRGYEVEAVTDGEAALAAAQRDKPDLILSDVMMPRLDGFGLLRALRAEPGLTEVPVILLSARAGEEARVQGLDAGADDYLTKPFSSRELLARVGANLSLTRVRRDAAEALRARSAELEAVLATVPAGVWFTRDADARHVRGNRRAAALLRLPEDANASLSTPEDERPGFRVFRDGVEAAIETLPILRAARGEEVRGDEQEIRFADGAPSVVLLCHATPLRNGEGQVAGAVCAAIDITSRRRIEEALREETHTLEVLNRPARRWRPNSISAVSCRWSRMLRPSYLAQLLVPSSTMCWMTAERPILSIPSQAFHARHSKVLRCRAPPLCSALHSAVKVLFAPTISPATRATEKMLHTAACRKDIYPSEVTSPCRSPRGQARY